jgi:hypothetical protein
MRAKQDSSPGWLSDSGLFEALKSARITMSAAE